MTCPNCGAEVSPRAKCCPECGSDEETGWSEAAHSVGLDVPEADFDYDEYVRREFGQQGPVPSGIHWFWWLVAIGVLSALLLWWFRLA